jgi:DNA-binding PadR family transcriptional regulator
MKNKSLITRNQRRLLDGLCDRWEFTQQVELAQEIWPANYGYIRKSLSRLQNLQFIEWVSQDQTSYEPRWFATEKGVRYLLDSE